MRITKLEMQNVGPFEDVSIDFQPNTNQDEAEIHIFTGVNGSGKSTILYGLNGIFHAQEIASRFWYPNESSWVRSHFERSGVDLGQALVNATFGGLPEKLADINEVLQYAELTSSPNIERIQNVALDYAVFAYSGIRSINVAAYPVESIKELERNPLYLTPNFRNKQNTGELLQWIATTKAKSAIAQTTGSVEQTAQYDLSISRIESAISQITSSNVRFIVEIEPLNVGIKVNDRELSFDILPDGLKSIIGWIADLLMRLSRLKWKDDVDVLDRSFILFLDEIEIHLHPTWQRQILPVVQKLFKNAQIFIATHSPFVVASVDDAWVHKLELQNGLSTVAQPVQSMAGSSYPYVLDEIFGIDEYFDVETEVEFQKFYKLRDAFLKSGNGSLEQLLELSTSLSRRSVETRDIIGRELRQLERITGQNIVQ